jgi:hypothetical protein
MNKITSAWSHIVCVWVYVQDTWQEARKLQDLYQREHPHMGWE